MQIRAAWQPPDRLPKSAPQGRASREQASCMQDKERGAQYCSVYLILKDTSTGVKQSCAAAVAFGQTLLELKEGLVNWFKTVAVMLTRPILAKCS